MKPIDDKKETMTFRSVSHDEEGKKRVTKTEVNTHNVDTLRHIEKKLMDKGVQRMERHPADGVGIGRPPPKSGRGGRYTWEGPADMAENELTPVPAAINDSEGRKERCRGFVVGELEAPKAEEVGVARIDVTFY